ncbi:MULTISPECIES: TrsD/TraD family conjugative transfer protein [Halobacillus]|uniref:TrsD/TraD family conjugative transfer protein n=1 Tax=Halobacillus TaxID=45667 RepID=UPI0009A7AB7B|nr:MULTISPECIES: TrsD/TraD family conjugative transfer protein [Halobacillus]
MFLQKNKASKNKPYDMSLHEREQQRQTQVQQSIQDMSLIKAQYLEYIVLNNNHLVAAMSATGINMELFNTVEQANVFDDYAAFLTSHFSGDTTNTSLQTLDMTVPVNFVPYILAWKKRYIEAEERGDTVKQNLIASYIEHFERFNDTSEMTTKEHLIVISEKMKDQSLESLEMASKNLDEKTAELKRSLENTFSNYDLVVRKLSADEYKNILYWFMNFNHR